MLNVRFKERTNTWPGFVDLFSNLVIILIFLLIVFVFLWTTTSVFNKSTGLKTVAELKKTTAEQAETIATMTADEQEAKRLLVMARGELETLQSDKFALEDEINAMDTRLKQTTAGAETIVVEYENKIAEITAQLNSALVSRDQMEQLQAERRAMEQSAAEQRAALTSELEKLNSALAAAEEKATESQIQYTEMSNRLNKALADKVAELNQVAGYQSEFYKSIKTALGDRTTIQPDGDRFIVSSDILFPSGQYALSPEGKKQLRLIANVIKDLEEKIPTDINWIIRVDGHTDRTRVVRGNRAYKNNTELSLLRATAVANELTNAGVSKRRLVPSGFGEMHPIELGNDAVSLQKNRRIELQLTNR